MGKGHNWLSIFVQAALNQQLTACLNILQYLFGRDGGRLSRGHASHCAWYIGVLKLRPGDFPKMRKVEIAGNGLKKRSSLFTWKSLVIFTPYGRRCEAAFYQNLYAFAVKDVTTIRYKSFNILHKGDERQQHGVNGQFINP